MFYLKIRVKDFYCNFCCFLSVLMKPGAFLVLFLYKRLKKYSKRRATV